ncbi:MAG: M23 family metallopeptidase [Bacteroidales bacterium]|nr:M23 family metallopeptidase [Bacteroidales bacterium]MCF8457368.1 M23 family metallopeptidase [Bacteroidales bacterium]
MISKQKKDLIYILIAGLLLLLISLYVIDRDRPTYSEQVEILEEELSATPIVESKIQYGLPVDSFFVQEGKVKRNQNLSDILVKQNISYQQIDELVRTSTGLFDMRKMKAGNHYSLFFDKYQTDSLCYFVYEISPIDYIVYHFNDSVIAERGQKEKISVRKYASGSIESSLWNAMKEADINPVLAVELSDVYAWAIDFFGIQKGDQFKVIYEEQYVDSQSIGITQIFAAVFTHNGHDYQAYEFTQDSTGSFFDEEGNSLRKAFLKAPLRYSRISSRFSNSRMHPVLKIRRPHHGVDYAAPTGTPVLSIGDGKVVDKGYQKLGGGRFLKIKHNSVYTTVYMHLNGYAKGIGTGSFIKQGQTIGYVGSSGLATGPHLDFRVYKNGSPVDPLKIESPPVEPVKEENKEEFARTMMKYQAEFRHYEKK